MVILSVSSKILNKTTSLFYMPFCSYNSGFINSIIAEEVNINNYSNFISHAGAHSSHPGNCSETSTFSETSQTKGIKSVRL